ncbi:MAG: M24 family metallopeptidase [Thermoanaerobaculia bacterium]
MKLTRRALLASAGAATAAAAVAPSALKAAPRDAAPLPPALKPEVFHERQARLREAARARGLDALFVAASTNLAYTANLAIGRSERLTALLLLTDGPALLVTPSFEEANHRREAVVDDVKTWPEDADPIALSARLLAGRKAVGIEGATVYATVSLLGAAMAARMEDATLVFDVLRMVKSDEEQTFIRDAGRRTNAAIYATHDRLKAGMTERGVARILEEEFTKQGARGGGLVQFGPDSAFPHGGPAERRLAKGDTVLIDVGCKVRGYSSDITRTVSFGPPSDEMRKVYATVEKAQLAGIDALKAGAIPEQVDRAARKVIEDAGYAEFFTHRLGHGLGMDVHEHPYLVNGNQTPLQAGNVVTIEPGIYMPGKFGVRIEDDYAVTKDGMKSLSVRPGDMVVVKP